MMGFPISRELLTVLYKVNARATGFKVPRMRKVSDEPCAWCSDNGAGTTVYLRRGQSSFTIVSE